jgi:hypothetical protein
VHYEYFGMQTSSKWCNYDAGDPASTNMAENIVVNFKVMFIVLLLLRYIYIYIYIYI